MNKIYVKGDFSSRSITEDEAQAHLSRAKHHATDEAGNTTYRLPHGRLLIAWVDDAMQTTYELVY